MTDPMGFLVTLMRDASIAGKRVRGGEPAQGDAQPRQLWQRFVVLTLLGRTREPRAPVQSLRVGVRAYAATYQDASALYGEISDLMNNAGPRVSASGIVIHNTLDSDSSQDQDPVTGQPYVNGVMEVIAGTALVSV
jgi:hypothetical protein